ncbi:MAG TPA: ATP-binding protein, partial [Burkholderiales bacterium]|nr:ATP-binding protein [Burkholderiales bacterium]
MFLHALAAEGVELRAAHVHHGLSPNADEWARFCRRLCARLRVRLTVRRVRPKKKTEEAARAARYAALRKLPFGALVLAHQL